MNHKKLWRQASHWITALSLGAALYSLTGEPSDYRPASEWVHVYLDALPEDIEFVDKEHYRKESAAAGHRWDAAAQAMNDSGRVKRECDPGNGRKNRWRIIRAETGATA